MELINQINNNLENKNEINNNQKHFLETTLGKTINSAIDIGLKSILPDLVENQIIEIKNSLLKNGLKGGINTAIDEAIDLGKSAIGIVTGNFENINQVENAIGRGGIINSISYLLDKTSDQAFNRGYMNNNINNAIKKGKNIILDNVSNNIRKEMEKQMNATERLEQNVERWKNYYNNKDFNGMEKEYKNIKKELEKVVPLENILKEARRVEDIHRLISSNGHNFEISELEKEIMKKLENK